MFFIAHDRSHANSIKIGNQKGNTSQTGCSFQFACAMASNGDLKFTDSNLGCTLRCGFSCQSFSRLSSDGTGRRVSSRHDAPPWNCAPTPAARTAPGNGSGQTNVPASLTNIIAIAAGG